MKPEQKEQMLQTAYQYMNEAKERYDVYAMMHDRLTTLDAHFHGNTQQCSIVESEKNRITILRRDAFTIWQKAMFDYEYVKSIPVTEQSPAESV